MALRQRWRSGPQFREIIKQISDSRAKRKRPVMLVEQCKTLRKQGSNARLHVVLGWLFRRRVHRFRHFYLLTRAPLSGRSQIKHALNRSR